MRKRFLLFFTFFGFLKFLSNINEIGLEDILNEPPRVPKFAPNDIDLLLGHSSLVEDERPTISGMVNDV